MTRSLAALFLLGAVAACHPPAPELIAVAALAAEAAPVATPVQVRERSELCAKASADRFRSDWKESGVPAPDGTTTADFVSHYNARLNICFYLLTVRQFTVTEGEGWATWGTLRKVLFDFGADEQYGEYLGPAIQSSRSDRVAARCKIEELFCFSEAEWNTLAGSYMKD